MRVFLHPTTGPYGVGRYIEGLLKELPRFVEVVTDAGQADIYHCNTIPVQGIPRVDVYTFHSTAVSRNPLVVRQLNIVRRLRPKFLVVPSIWQAKSLQVIADRRGVKVPEMVVIHHGAQFERLPKPRWSPNSYVLWGKAHLGRVGDNDILAEAANEFPNLQFKTTLWKKGMKRPRNLKVVGTMPFELMVETINRCSLVICTHPESGGIQAIEAMALGKPVLSVSRSGVAEVVEHRKSGYLWGSREDLLRGIEYCLTHYERISAAAKARAMRFNWRDSASKHVELYERCVG